jgi:sugar lactone lactonase YvrE
MVVDPAGRFAYVANLMSNASDEATISMYTINAGTGVLTPTTPATVPTGFFPQGIAIDPSGKFVYTANSDDNSVSMFTISQTTGVLTPTTPPSVSTLANVSTGLYSSPDAVTVDPSGRFAYDGGTSRSSRGLILSSSMSVRNRVTSLSKCVCSTFISQTRPLDANFADITTPGSTS